MKEDKEKNKRLNIFCLEIKMLMEIVLNIKKKSLEIFFGGTLGVGLIIGIPVGIVAGIPLGVATILVTISTAYLYLKSRLYVQRAGTSREGEVLVGELLANYKISYCNITEAIETTAKLIEDAPFSKALLFDLAIGLNTAVTKEEVNKLLDNFKHSIGTIWADILATNMYFAITQGINITKSLQDLSESLIKSRRLVEYNKRGINEASMMLKFLGPACIVLTVFCATSIFGMPLGKYIYYQFGTESGLSWFLSVVVSYIVGIGVNVYFSSKKLDL